MNVFRSIARALRPRRRYAVPSLLDHVPIETSSDWRRNRLTEAAQKHGKPFKCAAAEMPREVMIGGSHDVANTEVRGDQTRRVSERQRS